MFFEGNTYIENIRSTEQAKLDSLLLSGYNNFQLSIGKKMAKFI